MPRTLRAITLASLALAAPAHGEPAPESPYDPPDGYGRAGRIAVGAALGATVAGELRDVSVAPSLGWFVAERFSVAAVGGIARLETERDAATLWSALVEPAYHVALDDRAFGVLGLGVGVAYTHRLGTGLAIAPRIGVELALGRWVIAPALAYSYVTHRALPDDAVAADAVTRALRLQLGVARHW